MNEIADLLTILGNHFPLVAIGSVEALAAVFLLAKRGRNKNKQKNSSTLRGGESVFLKEINFRENEACVVIRQSDRMPVYATEGTEKLLGVGLQELQNDVTCLDHNLQTGEHRNGIWEHYRNWDGTHTEIFEFPMKNDIWLTMSMSSASDGRYSLLSFTDTTKQHNQIEQYEELLRKAEEESQSKTTFLNRMSHEIRTPMNGIIGMLNIADRYVDNPDEVKKYHQKIRMASEYLLSLINDVLDMRKIDQKDIMLLEESVNLRDVIENCRDILEAKAGEQEITLDTTGMAEFNPPQLMASEVHLRQIFMNIISNAIKYNKYGGKIFIQAIVLEQTEDKVTCRFSVTDTGIGMSEDFQKQMFEPFTQEHGENRSEFKGTGLGLSIVKRIIEEMGGEIRVESELDIGTKFSWDLTFPIDKAINERAENIPDRIVTLRGIRVLAAEDNSLNSEILKFILEDMGINVNLVENGELAVKAFQESRPGEYAMILMDIMMPVMDGYEASRIIRNMKRPDAAKIPIIALTANAFAEDIVRSSEAGMDAHITKPIDENKLKECMLRLLASR